MELKERLADLRRARGYTLRQLRDRIEERTGERMSVSYLSELERLAATPSVEALTRIANGYDLSLQELLAPVDFGDDSQQNSYPASLKEFVTRRGLDPAWLETLSRIEYRGKRPESADEWEVIYSVLKLTIAPRAEG